jgi:hypothetical protein
VQHCFTGKNMPRPTTLYGVAILSILIIVLGFIGYTFLSANQPAPAQSSTPNPTPTQNPYSSFPIDQTPAVYPTDATETDQNPQIITPEYVRDAAVGYVQQNHLEVAVLLSDVSWAGGRLETGLVGSEEYLYNGGNWVFTVQYPVVLNPVYSLAATYSGDQVVWQGTYSNIVIQETYFFFNSSSSQTPGPEQARDAAMNYIKVNHPQTGLLVATLQWMGSIDDNGVVGSSTYDYYSGGWSVTVQFPVVVDPTYNVVATYSGEDGAVSWAGTYQNGVVGEASYSGVFPTPTPTLAPTATPTSPPTPTPTLPPSSSSPSPTPSRSPTPTPTIPPFPTPPPTPASGSPEQARNQAVTYIRTAHNATVRYLPLTMVWQVQPGSPAGTSRYTSGGWNMTLVASAPGPNLSYNITAIYTLNGQTVINWTGRWQSQTVTERSYFGP